jgi:hypothetical protein
MLCFRYTRIFFLILTWIVLLALLGTTSAPFIAAAQVQGVRLGNPNALGDAFQGAVDDTFQNIDVGG